MTRTILQFVVRLLLGLVLLPLVWAAFLVFSLVAACSDRQLLQPRWAPPRRGWLGLLGLRRRTTVAPVEVDDLTPEVRAGS